MGAHDYERRGGYPAMWLVEDHRPGGHPWPRRRATCRKGWLGAFGHDPIPAADLLARAATVGGAK
jgi:hypothetical protein